MNSEPSGHAKTKPQGSPKRTIKSTEQVVKIKAGATDRLHQILGSGETVL